MPQVAVRLVLAAVLLAAAALKLGDRRAGPSSLGTYGLRSARARRVAWPLSIGAEVALAAGVAAGLDLAAYLAAALMAGYGVALAGALHAGRAGEPCGC